MSGRLAIVGLDGATFRVLDAPFLEGAMPALDGLRRRGQATILRSTVPPYTPPAWVSMATGVNPGRHGVLGFLASLPQEEPRIAHSGSIGATPMWTFLSEHGTTVGILNVPMSYPPQPVLGFMVAGGLASGWTDPELPDFASNEEDGQLVSRIAGGRYPLDVPVNYEADWRGTGIIETLTRAQELRRKALAALIDRHHPSVVFAVFEGVDRIQHVHYQYLVEGSDWYGRPEAPRVREAARRYFEEADRAVADLVDWAGDDGHVVVVSDHGAGPWEKTVNLNLLLAEWGYLELPGVSRLTRMKAVAGPLQRVGRRVLPRRLLHRIKARVGQRIRWDRTRAFASHVAEQGIHVNERGAMPEGAVDPSDVERLEREITDRLLELRDPDDGLPVTDGVVRREEVLHGPHLPRAPHLFPFLREQRYEVSDTLAASGPFTDHRDRPWGYHHVEGVFIAGGPGIAPGRHEQGLDIVDVLPTSLHLAGYRVPPALDGRVIRGMLAGAALARPVATAEEGGEGGEGEAEYPFSPEEEAAIEESLRGLGYIE